MTPKIFKGFLTTLCRQKIFPFFSFQIFTIFGDHFTSQNILNGKAILPARGFAALGFTSIISSRIFAPFEINIQTAEILSLEFSFCIFSINILIIFDKAKASL